VPAAPARADHPSATEHDGTVRPVNPFMVQIQNRRRGVWRVPWCRDLVVYHPENASRVSRRHTSATLFKDEIEKSWQEYVEQIGADLAKSTTFWGEALNEILAGGGKVF
jgi:hypothetical protein